MGSSIKTFIFDFDGTLVDSMSTYASTVIKILDDNHISYTDEIIKIITPLGFKGTAEYIINLGLNKPIEFIMNEMKNNMFNKYLYSIPAKPGVADVLNWLKQHGKRLNVLTASPHVTLDPCLKRLGLYDLFENVWSCDDFGTTKDNPDIYKMAAEKLKENVENIMFADDNLNADTAAKKSGVAVCGVYDKSSAEYTEQLKAVSDFYIHDFYELLELPIL